MKKWFYIHRWKFITLWIIAFTTTVIVLYNSNRSLGQENRESNRRIEILTKQSIHAAKENAKRIREIQASRLESCKITYAVIRRLLITSAQGIPLKGERKVRFDKLLALTDPAQCVEQTKPKKNKTQ